MQIKTLKQIPEPVVGLINFSLIITVMYMLNLHPAGVAGLFIAGMVYATGILIPFYLSVLMVGAVRDREWGFAFGCVFLAGPAMVAWVMYLFGYM